MANLPMGNRLQNVVLWIDGKGAIADRKNGKAYTPTDITLGADVYQGGEMIFNGSSSKIVCGALGNIKAICFWIKPTTDTQSIIDLDGTNKLTLSGGSVVATTWTGATVYHNNVPSGGYCVTGDWNFVAITSDTAINASAFTIGLEGSNYFTGSIANIRVFSDSLSIADIGRLQSGSPAKSSDIDTLINIGGLTFYKDYNNVNSPNAEYSVGSPVISVTATRTGVGIYPGSYIDDNGVVQTAAATDNTLRYKYGYYDETGFHKQPIGILVENQETNLCAYSYTYSNAAWDKTNVDVSDASASAPDGSNNASTLTASADGGTVILNTAVTARTYSVFLKRKTGSGAIQITADGTNFTTVNVTDSWGRFFLTVTSASQKCGIKIAVNTDAVYSWCSQFSTAAVPLSPIPTINATLQRNLETVTGVTSGNRNASDETIIIGFIPEGNFANDSVQRTLFDNVTAGGYDNRMIRKSTGATQVTFFPNAIDNGGVARTTSGSPKANVHYIIAGTCSHTNPSEKIFFEGTEENAGGISDFTPPNLYSTFYIGRGTSASQSSNCAITFVIIFNRALSNNEISSVYNIMNDKIASRSGNTTYYVASTGSNTATGLSTVSPFQTISKFTANSFHPKPGDTICLNKGDTFRETMTLKYSGADGKPITYTSYGTGNKPIISGADVITDWTNDNGTVYKKVLGLSHIPEACWYNDTRITYDSSKTTTLALNTWNYVAGTDTLWVNVGEDPATHPLEASIRGTPIISSVELSYITLSNLNVKGGDGFGVQTDGDHWILDGVDITNFGPESGNHGGVSVQSDNTIIKNGTFSGIYGDGIFIYDYHDILVDNMTIGVCMGTDQGSDCLQIGEQYADGVIVQNCNFDQTGTNSQKGCIRLGYSKPGTTGLTIIRDNDLKGGNFGVGCSRSNVIIERNYIHDLTISNLSYNRGGFAEISTDLGSLENCNVIVRNNIFYNNQRDIQTNNDGTGTNNISGIKIYNNTFVSPITYWIDLADSQCDVKNNIIYGDPATYVVYLRDSLSTSSTFNNNLYFTASSFQKISTTYANLALWQAGTGLDTNSTSGDPLFAGASDYHITVGSPAIGAGATLSDVTDDYAGATRTVPYDIGAYKYP